MEKAIINANKKKFKQAFGTPFYNYPYNKLFGYKGLTTFSQQVLDGTFIPPANAPNYIMEFLKHLAMPKIIKDNENKMEMTLDSFISYWRKAREYTSCYPSEFSFSVLKASSYNNSLAQMDCIMTRIPLVSGYSPTRWQRCVDVMIEKKIKYDRRR
jgi:hypothetical protein